MSFSGLRDFIEVLERQSELKHISGANWELEIGCITELVAERQGPALIFDSIPEYPKGFRVATNLFGTIRRMNIALGFPFEITEIELIETWRKKIKKLAPIPPSQVSTGPIKENIQIGNDVDLLKFPVPRWHELDGGRYIGTGDLVIMKDPETGWVNVGTYRIQVHDSKTAGIFCEPGQHGRIIMEKYWKDGKNCPVAVVCGQEPALFYSSTYKVPLGFSEYDLAGWIKNEAVKIIEGDNTGLPIPAYAEIAFEGEIPSPTVETRIEGPFGEYTGYYGGKSRPEPVIRVNTVMHRNDPIILGTPPLKPPTSGAFFLKIMHSGGVWDHLEQTGVPGVMGVSSMLKSGRAILVISIKQNFPGHSMQAGLAVASYRTGGQQGKFIIVVDDDINPTDTGDVLWAVATRCDPQTAIHIISGTWAPILDPSLPPDKRTKKDFTGSVAIIDACKPYSWINDFPQVSKASTSLRKKIIEKWGKEINLESKTEPVNSVISQVLDDFSEEKATVLNQ